MSLHLCRKALSSLLALGSCAVAYGASGVPVDLYVRERYRTASDEPCGFCGERDGCVLNSLNFYPEGSCRSRGGGRSSVYGAVDDGTLCRRDYPEESCEDGPAFDAISAEGCGQVWELGACEGGLRATALADWCVPSSEPTGEYVVPLVEVRTYPGEGCPPSDYRSLFRPGDGGLCVPASADGDAAGALLAVGSRTDRCEGDVLRVARHVGPGCAGVARPAPADGTTGECPAVPTGDGDKYLTSDCGSPSFHCKKLDLEGILRGDPPAATPATVSAIDPSGVENDQPATSETAAADTSANATSGGEEKSDAANPQATAPNPTPDPESASGALTFVQFGVQSVTTVLCIVIFVS